MPKFAHLQKCDYEDQPVEVIVRINAIVHGKHPAHNTAQELSVIFPSLCERFSAFMALLGPPHSSVLGFHSFGTY